MLCCVVVRKTGGLRELLRACNIDAGECCVCGDVVLYWDDGYVVVDEATAVCRRCAPAMEAEGRLIHDWETGLWRLTDPHYPPKPRADEWRVGFS